MSSVSTATRSSSGEWNVTSWPSTDRISPTAGTLSPANSTLVKLRRVKVIGAPATDW